MEERYVVGKVLSSMKKMTSQLISLSKKRDINTVINMFIICTNVTVKSFDGDQSFQVTNEKGISRSLCMWCEHLCQVHRKWVSGAKKNAEAKKKTNTKTRCKGKPNSKRRSPSNKKSNKKDTCTCLQCGQEDPPEAETSEDDDGIIG